MHSIVLQISAALLYVLFIFFLFLRGYFSVQNWTGFLSRCQERIGGSLSIFDESYFGTYLYTLSLPPDVWQSYTSEAGSLCMHVASGGEVIIFKARSLVGRLSSCSGIHSLKGKSLIGVKLFKICMACWRFLNATGHKTIQTALIVNNGGGGGFVWKVNFFSLSWSMILRFYTGSFVKSGPDEDDDDDDAIGVTLQ